jgi:hypothetical protein
LEVEHEFSELGQPQSQLFINQSHSDFSQEWNIKKIPPSKIMHDFRQEIS